VKTKLFLLTSMLIVIMLSPKIGYCMNLYLYSTENGADVLMKLQSPKGEWIQLAFKEDVSKSGNVTRKIYKPTISNDGWDLWNYQNVFRNIATIKWTTKTPEAESKLLPSSKDRDFIIFYLFITYLRDQLKSGYSAVINIAGLPFALTVYDVNKMLTMSPSDNLIRHLGNFGYGIINATGVDLIRKAEGGSISVIFDPPFKEPYAISMNQFTAKIEKPKERSPYLLIILTGLVVIIGLLGFNFYTMSKIKKIQREKNELAPNLFETESHTGPKDEESVKQSKNDFSEREKYYLDIALSAVREVQQVLAEQTTTLQADLPVYKIQSLIESMGAKLNGKWVDASKKRLSEIVRNMPEIDATAEFPDPISIDEFREIKWSERFTPAIKRLITIAESRNLSKQVPKQELEAIGRDVITTVVGAVDREKNLNPSVEDDLKQLLAMVGMKEMDVKPGQVYSPDLHDLVISNDPSLVTDREQKITKIISQGLILPSGKIIKAKVSIQRQA
jgi:hypothetical protein